MDETEKKLTPLQKQLTLSPEQKRRMAETARTMAEEREWDLTRGAEIKRRKQKFKNRLSICILFIAIFCIALGYILHQKAEKQTHPGLLGFFRYLFYCWGAFFTLASGSVYFEVISYKRYYD